MSKKLIAGAGVVASLAVALAPLATFADIADDESDQHTDELVITVPPSCTFGDALQETSPLPGGITHGSESNVTYNATPTTSTDSHTDDDVVSTGYGSNVAAGGITTSSNLNASEHTILKTVQAGTTAAGFASTVMKVVCTNTEGYTIQVATPNLYNETTGYTSENIPALNGTGSTKAASYSATNSGYDLDSIVANNGAASASDVVEGAATFYANATAGTAETIIEHTGVSAATGDTITVTYGVGIQSNQAAGTYSGKVVYTLLQGIEE